MPAEITKPDWDSFEESEFHDVTTLALGELWKDGWFDLSDESWDFPKYSQEQHDRLCRKILNHFYMRNIGVLPLGAWKREFLRTLDEVMPKYIPLYKQLDGNGGALNTSDEYYKGRNVSSDYPQTRLAGNEDYASMGVDKQYERLHEGSVMDTAEKIHSYDDVDLMVIKDLDPLFSCLVTVNINAW